MHTSNVRVGRKHSDGRLREGADWTADLTRSSRWPDGGKPWSPPIGSMLYGEPSHWSIGSIGLIVGAPAPGSVRLTLGLLSRSHVP